MKSRVDESDADNPQVAPSGAFGAPADEADTAPADPLAALFGVREQSARTDAGASASSQERLAALFAQYESARPAVPSQPASPEIGQPALATPPDDFTADDVIELDGAPPID